MTEEASDEILMAAYQAGNREAFEMLFERYASSIYGFLVRSLTDRDLAADVHQEVFLRVHRARRSYDATRPFRTWLFAIVYNLLKDALRARRRSAPIESRERGAATLDALIDERSPERIAGASEAGAALTRALQALPADEATVLILARLEGLPYDDIGPIVGRSSTAAKQLAYRALKRVREHMRACGHAEDL